MELRQLRYLDAVARRRSFTQAALDLHLAQSALSQQVGRLERELGVQLFIRGRRVERRPEPVLDVKAVYYRNNPILRGTIEGSMPGSYSENAVCSSIMRAATAWNVPADVEALRLTAPDTARRWRAAELEVRP